MMRKSPTTTHASTSAGKTSTQTLSIFLLFSLILSSALFPWRGAAAGFPARVSASKDDDVKVRVERAQGLIRIIFSVRGVGTDYVNFPGDMPPGGVISGTVFAVPDGPKDVVAKNRKALERYAVEVDGRKIAAGRRVFRLTLPPASQHASVAVRLLDDKGKAVAEESVAVSSQRPEQPKDFSFPPYTQSGQFLSVACPCDGVITDDDFLKIGGAQVLTLAKSSGQVAALNTSEAVGPTEIEIRERGQVRKGTTRNISLKITADSYALRSGQRTTMRVVISGLEGLNEVLHWRLRNYSTGVLTMSGGDEQELDIRPEDVQAGGLYTTERILTGITVGAFFIEGVINWKQPEERAAVDRRNETAAAPAAPGPANEFNVSVVGDRLAFKTIEDYERVVNNPPEELRARFVKTVNEFVNFTSYAKSPKPRDDKAARLISDEYFATIINSDLAVQIGENIFRVNPVKEKVYVLPVADAAQYHDLIAEKTANKNLRVYSTGDDVLKLVKYPQRSALFCRESGIGGKSNSAILQGGGETASAVFLRLGIYFTLSATISPQSSSSTSYLFDFTGGTGHIHYHVRCGSTADYEITSAGFWTFTSRRYQSYQGSTNLNELYFGFRVKSKYGGYYTPFVVIRQNW